MREIALGMVGLAFAACTANTAELGVAQQAETSLCKKADGTIEPLVYTPAAGEAQVRQRFADAFEMMRTMRITPAEFDDYIRTYMGNARAGQDARNVQAQAIIGRLITTVDMVVMACEAMPPRLTQAQITAMMAQATADMNVIVGIGAVNPTLFNYWYCLMQWLAQAGSQCPQSLPDGGTGDGGADSSPYLGIEDPAGSDPYGAGDADTMCASGTWCDSGSDCLTGSEECVDGAVLCELTPVADGTSCGTDMVCQNGDCVSGCTPGGACDTGDPCQIGMISCSSGSPVCEPMPAPDGTSCGTDMECQAGVCTTICTPGGACDTGDPCQIGTISCSSGSPVCEPMPAPDGTSCGTNMSCQAGVCTADESAEDTDGDDPQQAGCVYVYDTPNCIAGNVDLAVDSCADSDTMEEKVTTSGAGNCAPAQCCARAEMKAYHCNAYCQSRGALSGSCDTVARPCNSGGQTAFCNCVFNT